MIKSKEDYVRALELLGALHQRSRQLYRACQDERAELWESEQFLMMEVELGSDLLAGVVTAIGRRDFTEHLLKHAEKIEALRILDEPTVGNWFLKDGIRYPKYGDYIAGVDLIGLRLREIITFVRASSG